ELGLYSVMAAPGEQRFAILKNQDVPAGANRGVVTKLARLEETIRVPQPPDFFSGPALPRNVARAVSRRIPRRLISHHRARRASYGLACDSLGHNSGSAPNRLARPQDNCHESAYPHGEIRSCSGGLPTPAGKSHLWNRLPATHVGKSSRRMVTR